MNCKLIFFTFFISCLYGKIPELFLMNWGVRLRTSSAVFFFWKIEKDLFSHACWVEEGTGVVRTGCFCWIDICEVSTSTGSFRRRSFVSFCTFFYFFRVFWIEFGMELPQPPPLLWDRQIILFVLLIIAACRYGRDWRYHKKRRQWLTRLKQGEVRMQTATYEIGSYTIFDYAQWRKVRSFS